MSPLQGFAPCCIAIPRVNPGLFHVRALPLNTPTFRTLPNFWFFSEVCTILNVESTLKSRKRCRFLRSLPPFGMASAPLCGAVSKTLPLHCHPSGWPLPRFAGRCPKRCRFAATLRDGLCLRRCPEPDSSEALSTNFDKARDKEGFSRKLGVFRVDSEFNIQYSHPIGRL
jgi:hypothetical protein